MRVVWIFIMALGLVLNIVALAADPNALSYVGAMCCAFVLIYEALR